MRPPDDARVLIEELRGKGARLRAEGLLLRVEAPPGTVTADLREALTEHKREILRLLAREERRLQEADRLGLVIKRSHEPGWISLHDPTTGEWHEIKEIESPPWIVHAANAHKRYGGRR